jgi:hypothetical protein
MLDGKTPFVWLIKMSFIIDLRELSQRYFETQIIPSSTHFFSSYNNVVSRKSQWKKGREMKE